MGVELLDLRKDGHALTDAGLDLLQLALRMEETGAAIGERMAGQGGVSGTIRIGAPDGLGNAWLAQTLPKLRLEQPDLEIELVPVPRAHKLWRREVDIAISLEPPETGRVLRRRLVEYDLRLYGTPAVLRKSPVTAAEDLQDFPFVGYIDELLYSDELDFNQLILPHPNAHYRAATVQAQLEAVRAGLGLACCHAIWRATPDCSRFCPIRSVFVAAIGCWCPKR